MASVTIGAELKKINNPSYKKSIIHSTMQKAQYSTICLPNLTFAVDFIHMTECSLQHSRRLCRILQQTSKITNHFTKIF